MKIQYNIFVRAIVIGVLLSTVSANGWKIDVTNITERILEVQGEMVAAIPERRHTGWKLLAPGESITFDTGVREVKGIKVRLPIGQAAKSYNYPTIDGDLLRESRIAMTMNTHYVITYLPTLDDKGGSTETFFLLRIPNIPLSRKGGIVAESKPIYFGPNVNVPGVLDNQLAFKRWEGSDDMAYDQAHYVMAHNAYASTKYGYTIDPQQDLSITELLKYGLRGINLDTYLNEGQIQLIHRSATMTKLLLKPLQKIDTLKVRMDDMINFMHAYPKVVITITFEDHVGRKAAKFDETLKPYGEFIFTPSDFKTLDSKWPTLGWLRSKNKRIIIFKNPPLENAQPSKDDQPAAGTTGGESKYIFDDEWKYHIENDFSRTEKKEVATERAESKKYDNIKRTLYILNFFAEFNPARHFPMIQKEAYKSTLKDAVDYVLEHGLDGKFIGQKPNFFMLDFAEWSDGLAIVHDWNQPRPPKSEPQKPA